MRCLDPRVAIALSGADFVDYDYLLKLYLRPSNKSNVCHRADLRVTARSVCGVSLSSPDLVTTLKILYHIPEIRSKGHLGFAELIWNARDSIFAELISIASL
jgi:hypothetical protein